MRALEKALMELQGANVILGCMKPTEAVEALRLQIEAAAVYVREVQTGLAKIEWDGEMGCYP